MIKFEILTSENWDGLAKRICAEGGFCQDEVKEITASFSELCEEEDIEVGLTACYGCLLARIFDMGRYMFAYPVELCDGAEPLSAIREIREYARREELPLVLTDIPADRLGELAPLFNHTVIDAESGGESFRLEARSECSLLDEPPTLTTDAVTLDGLLDSDAAELARLNRDVTLNEYWGYDYREDSPDASDGYFLEVARSEFYMGTALSLAVRAECRFIGEAVIYGFDLSGGAEVGVRILREYQGRGYGSAALEALVELAESIGLARLTGRADERNIPSIRMMRAAFDEVRREDGRVYYEKLL